jgi:prepilin-type N-terminal cleavage/methylation domain-containing protein
MRSTFFTFPRAYRKSRSGLTLVEVMVATVIFTLVALGCLSAIISTYKINDRTRYRDLGRSVLLGVAEDFLRGPLSNSAGVQRPLFNNINASGAGIEIKSFDENTTYTADGAGVLDYPLGTVGSKTVLMRITRTVYTVNPTNGNSFAGTLNSLSLNGYMKACALVGTFTLHGRTETISLTVTRTARFD